MSRYSRSKPRNWGESMNVRADRSIPAEAVSVASGSAIAIGTWSNEILLYSLDLNTHITLSENAYAKSLLFHGPTLLAGLSDGSLVVYELDGLTVTSKKVSSLGTRPLDLHPVEWEGDEKILAIGLTERMSAIFAKDRVDFSSVGKKNITAATSMNGQLVLASSTGITISSVNSLKKLSVQTMDLKEKSVTKLAYFEGILATGVVERNMSSVTGEIIQRAGLELRDATSLRGEFDVSVAERYRIDAATPKGGGDLSSTGTAFRAVVSGCWYRGLSHRRGF